MNTQRFALVMLTSGLLLGGPAMAQTDMDTEEDTMTVVDMDGAPEDVVNVLELPDVAAEAAVEAAARGLGTAERAREDGRAFGEQQAERAREDGRAFGREQGESARERARDARESAGESARDQAQERARDMDRPGAPDDRPGPPVTPPTP